MVLFVFHILYFFVINDFAQIVMVVVCSSSSSGSDCAPDCTHVSWGLEAITWCHIPLTAL